MLSLFSFSMFLGQETQERGRSHFYPPKSVSRARRLRQIAARRRTRCGSWRGEGESFCQVFNGGEEDSSYILASLLLLLL